MPIFVEARQMDLVESGNKAVEMDRRHPWELARVDVIKRVLRDMVELRAGDIVLDVGCGDSFMTEQIARVYPAVTFYGIDTGFDEQLVDTLTGKQTVSNLRLFKTLEDAALHIGNGKAAVVLLMDVIEHIQDDVSFLRRLQSSPLVHPQARYVLSVPAFGFLFSAHDVVLGHYRRYSNKMLERHLKQAGLEPLVIGYFFSSLLLPRLVLAAKEKLLRFEQRRTTQVAEWHGSQPWQSFIKNVLVWDFRVSWALYRRGVKLPGLSNLAICRRSA
jgi:2-polyprenyl-3-methyl-5-hydroxy-6-metoxy-1,4-benzoquinol methylase